MLGTQVGNYEVTSQIGLGGMGVVYLAHHTMLSRPAAVKVLRAEMSHNRDIVSRFFNEARAATAIRHPGIVEIYDFGYLPDGSAYIIMELLDGESLSDRIVRLGRLSVGHALAAARQIASALGAAHAQQIVHRDLKPENVFIVADPEREGGERLKLLDFGIAKLAAASGERSQTRTGEVIGTPTFMSPEQCRGAGKVDARSDLYSLGCLLYVLLCGRPPFIAEGAGDIIAHHLYFPPEPPSRHEPSLPVGVEQLVLWLLQKDPDARPATAAAVIEAIDALGASTTVSLPAPPRPRLPSQVASRPPQQAARAGQASTTLSGSASQVRAKATPHTVMVRPRSRWLLPSMIGGALALGVVIAFLFNGGDEQTEVTVTPGAGGGAETSESPPFVTPGVPQPETSGEAAPHPSPEPPPVPAPAPKSDAGAPARRSATRPQKQDASAPTVVFVDHVIESNPAGAKVMLSNKQVGTTPFRASVPLHSSARKYTLRKEGFEEAMVVFSKEDQESQRQIQLRKVAARAPSRPAPGKNESINPFLPKP